MRRRVAVIVALLVGCAALAAGLRASGVPGPEVKPAPAFEGKAVVVQTKGNVTYYLERPTVKRLADRPFVVGRGVGRTKPAMVWVPVDEVVMVDEFADVGEMSRWYRLDAGPER
jgi:hypothetical protein